jgi:hypothetical protein
MIDPEISTVKSSTINLSTSAVDSNLKGLFKDNKEDKNFGKKENYSNVDG